MCGNLWNSMPNLNMLVFVTRDDIDEKVVAQCIEIMTRDDMRVFGNSVPLGTVKMQLTALAKSLVEPIEESLNVGS